MTPIQSFFSECMRAVYIVYCRNRVLFSSLRDVYTTSARTTHTTSASSSSRGVPLTRILQRPNPSLNKPIEYTYLCFSYEYQLRRANRPVQRGTRQILLRALEYTRLSNKYIKDNIYSISGCIVWILYYFYPFNIADLQTTYQVHKGLNTNQLHAS